MEIKPLPIERSIGRFYYKDLTNELVAVLYLVPIIVINGERTFLPAFIQSYIFGNAISWFDALVLDCLWFHIKFAVQGIVLLAVPFLCDFCHKVRFALMNYVVY